MDHFSFINLIIMGYHGNAHEGVYCHVNDVMSIKYVLMQDV